MRWSNGRAERHIYLDPQKAVILSADEARTVFEIAPAEEVWTPTESNVIEFETAMLPVLSAKLAKINAREPAYAQHPADYYRQYFGLTKAGHQILVVNAFTASIIDPAGEEIDALDNWRHRNVAGSVFDGCTSIFYASYDVKSKKLVGLLFDGCA